MATRLYRKHAPALAATFADVENHALSQDEAIVGTPGSITVRENASDTRFYVRQYYDFDGRKRDQYLCRVDSEDCERALAQWTKRLEEARDIRKSVRLLAREGFSVLPQKHLAALAPLSMHGIFEAGGVLVGTHAFEVIVNRLGVRAVAFATEDVDIARPSKLALEKPPKGGLLELLRESGIDFVGVPGLKHGAPPTSYKEQGRSRFTFDLLVPASGDKIETLPVPELEAHATALPYLRYLLAETQMGVVISTHGVVAVRVPVPERFALHKLLVAQLRTGRSEKSRKDMKQAAVLIAATGDLFPGALEAAYERTPRSARARIRDSLRLIEDELQAHPRAWDEIARASKL